LKCIAKVIKKHIPIAHIALKASSFLNIMGILGQECFRQKKAG
jgi:hypothetical protein